MRLTLPALLLIALFFTLRELPKLDHISRERVISGVEYRYNLVDTNELNEQRRRFIEDSIKSVEEREMWRRKRENRKQPITGNKKIDGVKLRKKAREILSKKNRNISGIVPESLKIKKEIDEVDTRVGKREYPKASLKKI